MNNCYYCNVPLVDTSNSTLPDQWTEDHVMPLSRGGGNAKSNKVPCCRSCNCRKKGRTLLEFRIAEVERRAGWPKFTVEQREWLVEQGFKFPDLPPLVFAGEKP